MPEGPREFLLGANLPWIRYGGDFGANAWQPEGGLGTSGRTQAAREALRALAERGAQAVRWFLLCDARAGVRFDAAGDVAGLDDLVFRDMDAALHALSAARVRAIFVLVDFTCCSRRRIVNGVQLGGRSHLLTDASRRAPLLEHAFVPILRRYGHEPAILAWDIINEPDWVIRRVPLQPRAVPKTEIQSLVRETAALVHDLTTHQVTVGSAQPSTLPLFQGLGLDFYQVHWYDKWRCRFDLDAPALTLNADAPVVLGEFPTRNTRREPVSIVTAAQRRGYAGALAWSGWAEDRESDRGTLYATLLEISGRQRG